MSVRKKLQAGEYLFRQGDSPGAMYVLMTGALAVEARDEQLALVTTPGAFVGELSFLTGNPRSADVKATVDSRVLVIRDIDQFFRDDPTHAVAVARELARRLDVMDRKFLQMKRLADSAAIGDATINAVVDLLNSDGASDNTGLV